MGHAHPTSKVLLPRLRKERHWHLENTGNLLELVINTGTTIVTFLMVFLIQNSQNRDSAAIQVKLDELIRVSKANNAFMGLEHLTDEELEDIEGKNEGRAKAVLEARKASEDAKHKLRVIDGDG